MQTIYLYMVPVYGRMVEAGKYTVDETDMTKKLVPAEYLTLVVEWLASRGYRQQIEEATTTDDVASIIWED